MARRGNSDKRLALVEYLVDDQRGEENRPECLELVIVTSALDDKCRSTDDALRNLTKVQFQRQDYIIRRISIHVPAVEHGSLQRQKTKALGHDGEDDRTIHA